MSLSINGATGKPSNFSTSLWIHKAQCEIVIGTDTQREGGKEGKREGGMEGERVSGRKGGREGKREGGISGGRERA